MDNKKVVIKWYDARIYPGMHKLKEAQACEMEIFDSLGYLIDINKTTTRIAHEVTDTGEYRDILLIPSGSIISMHELKISGEMRK